VNWRRSSAYASLVRPRYPARKPASASRSASLNAGGRGTRAVVAAVIGYLLVRAETNEAGPAAASATIRYHHQAALYVTCCHSLAKRGATLYAGNAPNRCRIRAVLCARALAPRWAQISQFGAVPASVGDRPAGRAHGDPKAQRMAERGRGGLGRCCCGGLGLPGLRAVAAAPTSRPCSPRWAAGRGGPGGRRAR
jgi:hypothetical protein